MVITTQPGAENEATQATQSLADGGGEQQECQENEEKCTQYSSVVDKTQITCIRTPTEYKGELPEFKALISLEGVYVEQKVDYLEIFTSWESKNQYDVKTISGTQLFKFAEKSNFVCRNLNKKRRGFEMMMIDSSGKEFGRLLRPCRCFCYRPTICASCSGCTDSIIVEVPPGNKIGRVQQRSGRKLYFNLYNRGNGFAYINGPAGCGFCWVMPEKYFKLYSLEDHSEVGMITKLFGGVIKEFFTDADTFRITFPLDMSLSAKVIIISSAILIDFIAFEDNEGRKKFGIKTVDQYVIHPHP